MDQQIMKTGAITFVDENGKPYRAAAVKWWTHCGSGEPMCDLYWFPATEGASPVVATAVPHKSQVTRRGYYWMTPEQGVEANLEPAPVPTSTGGHGSPP